MKNLLILLFAALFSSACLAQMPTQIAGIKLNSDISEYDDYIKSQTTLPIRFMEYLDEVEVRRFSDFKSGYIAYGNCAQPGKIVRIKLKYNNSSKKYFENLLEEYKDQLGKPDEWQGDPFHVVTAWKWSFSEGNNQVDLFLQHNVSDADFKIGTSMKLTMTNLIEAEKNCFNEKYPDFRKAAKMVTDTKASDWEGLIPR
ncbi:MAG: hypothetical protein V7731_15370 [Amphritea sp.]